MAKRIIKKIITICLVIVPIIVLIVGSAYLLNKGMLKNIQNLNYYNTESPLILKTINNIISADCDGVRVDPWYCDSPTLKVEKIEAFREKVYALGSGVTKHQEEFWWLAAKENAYWGYIYFQDTDQKLPSCEEIKEIPPTLFDGIVNKCLENGKEVNR